MLRIGILSLQGGVEEHESHLKKLCVETFRIKKPGQLANCQGLILPGGESTAIGKTLIETSLHQEIINYANKGMPIWGTCAGMILLSKEIENQKESYLKLLDVTICRNGFGRQLDSFTAEALIPEVSNEPIPLIFIRAPYVKNIGRDVQTLLQWDNKIVAVQQDSILGTSFHPELTDDLRFHQYFLQMVK
ncbi:MAG: pyridoxal 5'-phosphate synthase glutaminase subunit PdxT [Halanaerobiales bacterium]|nr:pyridoxal 5'-phosphate synthase glutaminase subunit PdxT [Halanaerobiales bacterium]